MAYPPYSFGRKGQASYLQSLALGLLCPIPCLWPLLALKNWRARARILDMYNFDTKGSDGCRNTRTEELKVNYTYDW